MIPLFQHFPALQKHLLHTSLGTFPTPVKKLNGLCEKLGTDNLYIKCDNLSGSLYGGNKVRKLEFLLAQALAQGAKTVVTMGGTGSNHALATALYARHLGLKCTVLLSDQPNTPAVRSNLRMDLASGAEILHFSTFRDLFKAIPGIVAQIATRDNRTPLLIPTGGTNPQGTIGFVNAGFELAQQIQSGSLPEPDIIFVAFGSMGTAVGLALGIHAAGLKTKVTGVRVVPGMVGCEENARKLCNETCLMLHRFDPTFPLISYETAGMSIDEGWFGDGYGVVTPEATHAIKAFDDADGIALDGVYTGKAGGAFLAHAQIKSRNNTALFWNTKSSATVSHEALALDYHLLPSSLHGYFTTEVQELDRQ